MKIEVDEDVYAFLEKEARPFVDTPNTVLRRLLLSAGSFSKRNQPARSTFDGGKTSTMAFVRKVLRLKFSEKLSVVPGYQYMFRGDGKCIYFQNFNKPSTKLWYRVSHDAWGLLRARPLEGFLVLTCPVDGVIYVLPADDIWKQTRAVGWKRDYLEINIDREAGRWIDLNWNIDAYKQDIG